jgi:nucleoside phosphorylase
MLSRASESFLLSELQQVGLGVSEQQQQKVNPKYAWFRDNSNAALAGRCLLDVLEYLRADPKIPGRFRHVTNAHAIRLTHHCLSDPELDRLRVLKRLTPNIRETTRHLMSERNSNAPYFGDDFWDWAAVLLAFAEIKDLGVIDDDELSRDVRLFYECVASHIEDGLTFSKPGVEWYGPATAALAHRALSAWRDLVKGNIDPMLATLREQALEPITNGKYREREVSPHLVIWHYGQVIAEFPDAPRAKELVKIIGDLSPIKTTMEKTDQVYALARALQGANATNNAKAANSAITRLYECQNLDRPLGQGLVGENVKGSLNVLEALWPALAPDEKADVGAMVDNLLKAHIAANTVGVLVAIPREEEALSTAFEERGGVKVAIPLEELLVRNAFKDRGAVPKPGRDVVAIEGKPPQEITVIEHERYRVVICRGKALIGVTDATRTLIDKYKAKWVIMSGIAGSLGSIVKEGENETFRGPDVGHVVVAATMAPYRIRDKVRDDVIINAKVPLGTETWMVIPTNPTLFGLAHEIGSKEDGDKGRFYEGMIVTGNGIKDCLKEKAAILKAFPGGLAVEEEGYAAGIVCMASRIPYLNIRGISDRAQGDKVRQTPEIEKEEQEKAANAAARLAVRVVEKLSESW